MTTYIVSPACVLPHTSESMICQDGAPVRERLGEPCECPCHTTKDDA